MSTKKRGLFSRKPHAPPAVAEVPAPSPTTTGPPPIATSSWPTSPSPPLPSDSQGIFPPRSNSSGWNSTSLGGGTTLGDHNRGVSEDGRKVSLEVGINRSPSQKSVGFDKTGEKHHGGLRSLFGRNKRSTLPAQPREVPSGIPVPVKSGGMPRSQSSGVLSSNSTTRGGDEQQQNERERQASLRSPASHTTQLSYSSPSLNFTPASPTHPRIRAHHEEQARLTAAAAAGQPLSNSFSTPARSPLSPTSTPLPFSPASSHFSQALAPYDDAGSLRSRSDGITPGSTPTSSRRTPLPTPSPPTNDDQLSPLFTSTPLVVASRSPLYGNSLPSSPTTLAPPFRIRVFIDHPTTEPLYITVNPGTETLRSLKHKILRVDNERFVQFRQARRPPVETKWDIHPHVGEEEEGRSGRAGDKTYDFDRRIQLFRVSVDWLVVSKTKRNYEKTRTFQSVLASNPSTPILTPNETDLLPLLNLFPATPASAAARLKGLIEIVVRIVPPGERGSVPVLVSFSDMPDQPVVVDVEKGWTVHAVKEAIGKARGLAVRIVGGGRSQLGGEDFFLFKASQPRHTSAPLPYDIDHFEGLAPETLFDDEDQEFATHPFVVEAGLDLPESLLRRVELVAFLIADMEEDFRDGLKMKTHHTNDTLRAGHDYGVSPAAAIMNNARLASLNRQDPARPSSRGSNDSSVNSGKRPPARDQRGDPRENGNGNGNGSHHHHHRGDPRDQRDQQQQQRSPRSSPNPRSPHSLPSSPFSSGSSSERQHPSHHQQQPSYSSSSASSRNPQQQYQQHHSSQPSSQQYQQQQHQQASSYEKQLRQHQQQQQQAAEISPPITPSGSLHHVPAATAPRNIPKVNGSYTPPSASFSPTTSPLGSPTGNKNFDSSSSASEPGPPSPSSYKTALANAEDWVSPRLVSNLASHQRSSDLDPLEHSSTSDGLEDVLNSYEGGGGGSSSSSAGSLGLSDAGGVDGLKRMLEKARSGSVEEERKLEVKEVEAKGEEGEGRQEEMERRHEEMEEEERDSVDPHWTRSPGGGLSLGPVVEEDEPLSPASSTFGAKLKQPAHSRTSSSSSSTTSPLLLVHIRKPYAGPFTDTTSFASDDISPTSCPIPLPPIHSSRNPSDASSDFSQTSFATTPESPTRVVRKGSSLPDGSEVDRSGNTSPIGSERTVVPSHPSSSTRNLSLTSSEDDRSTVHQPPSPAAVAQRFRFASIEATSVPPRTNSPTRIKYAHSMAANGRRGSTINGRKGSYVVREGLATGYPLRSALKGGKAKAKAAHRPVVRNVSSRDIAPLNGRNVSLNGGGRNSILLGTNNSPTKRNSFLVNSGRFPSNVRTGSNSSLRTSISSSAGTTSSRSNGVNGIHSILRKPTPPQQTPNNNGSNTDNTNVDLSNSLPPSPAQSPPPQDFESLSRMGSMCAEGYAVIGGAMFSVTLRPMDEKGAMVMGTREFKAAGPLFKLESAH